MAILRKNTVGKSKGRHQVAVLLGGNLGDVMATFKQVEIRFRALGEILQSSSVYRTEAWGMQGAPDFYNQVLLLETGLEPEELMERMLGIEKELGRSRNTSPQYTSRPIDLDILFYDRLVLETKKLVIPHPRLQQRRFALQPLEELIPDYEHPVLRKTISTLILELDDNLSVTKV